jgi:hypothetical protein
MNRFVVEYRLPGGMVETRGIIIFTAEDMTAAEVYVSDMVTCYGHTYVSSPIPLPIDAAVIDLYRLYSGNTSSLLK